MSWTTDFRDQITPQKFSERLIAFLETISSYVSLKRIWVALSLLTQSLLTQRAGLTDQ